MKKFFNSRFVFLSAVVISAAFTRLIPHYPNFTAIGALALFGGAYFENRKEAFLVPFAAMLLTDFIIGFHPGMYAVYAAFALIVAIGFTLSKKRTVTGVALASVSASVSFFVITNFAVWITGTLYAKNAAGLAACFAAAVPFFSYTALGDIFFAALLFGTYELVQIKIPSLVKA